MNASMQALQIEKVGPRETLSQPLTMVTLPRPSPGVGEVLIRVSVCAICHTELDEIEGQPHLPYCP